MRITRVQSTNNCKHFVFASSAAVYGEPEIFPTPETSFLRQTSIYGASKLAGEAYIQAYSEYSDFQSSIKTFMYGMTFALHS